MNPFRFTLLLILISQHLFGQEIPPTAERGTIDLRTWNLSTEKVALNGYWNFYENELLNISDSTQKTGKVSLFPEIWEPSLQYATYQLWVLMPHDTGTLALEMPQLYCSYALWVNGKKIAENGKVGNSKETSVPQWLPQSVPFKSSGDTLSIVLQISNFYHSKGGAKEPIYLGNSDTLKKHHAIALKSSVIESLALAILGLSFFVIYYVREEKKKITLYFSLLCITWAIRALFSNTYASISYFPNFDWGLLLRIEYITLFLTMIWAILFLGRLFLNESSKIIKYMLVGSNSLFIAITIVSPPSFFTQWLTVYLVAAGILLVFGASIVIRAWINERSGVWYLVICVILCIVLFGYDIFVYEGFLEYYNALFFSVGYLIMFVLMGISLLYHLQIFKGDSSSGMLTYDDLYGNK